MYVCVCLYVYMYVCVCMCARIRSYQVGHGSGVENFVQLFLQQHRKQVQEKRIARTFKNISKIT